MPNDQDLTPQDIKKAELASDFRDEIDLAFFVVNLQMSVSDYHSLTETERMFIRKAYEQKFMSDTTWMRNAVLNAEANVNRKKSKKFIDLFPKKQKADKEYNENAIQNILEMEEEQGKSWVDKVYKANGMQKPISERKE